MKLENEIWSRVFDNGPVCMFLWENITGEWPVVDVTANIETLTGWNDEDFLSGRRNYAELIHPDDIARVEAEEDAWKSSGTSDSVNMNYRIVASSGDEKHVSEFTQAVRDEAGVITHLAGYIVDVTDHQLMLEEKRSAENADRAKSEFLANMSHEIRTPMNGVLGMAELLSSTELDAKQKMFTDVIVKSGNSLLTIINDILDFSKLDAGQLELDPVSFNLAEAIEDVATLVSAKISEKDLELIMRIDPDLPQTLVGDVGRIRQIITNLVGNAVKFTEKGHVYVNVTRLEGGDEDTCLFRISVSDTGIGIPDIDLQKIFQKFSQVDSSATRRHEGTGLGLSISSSLVKLMGGEISVKSNVGEGSDFWFDICLPEGKTSAEKPLPFDVTGSTILAVDDNPVNRAILSEQLTGWGFEHAVADSGQAALSIMQAAARRNVTIDCVILDYHMPGLSGADVVHAMKADSQLAGVPIVMLTSVNETKDNKTFSSLGIDGHLVKPARASALLENLVTVLQTSYMVKQDDVQDGISSETPPEELSQMPQISPQPEEGELPEDSQDFAAPECSEAADGPLQVLVCEDNPVNQMVFSQVLGDLGVTFELANDGVEGVEKYEKRSPKLVLMDVSMPNLNGLEATAKIREIEKFTRRNTPIIGVTAHAIKGDMERCLEAGMDDYVSKPISPKMLKQRVIQWLGHNGGQTRQSSG